MDHVLNEYLVEEFGEILPDGQFKVTYNPLDHMPFGAIRGCICINQYVSLDFTLTPISDPRSGYNSIIYTEPVYDVCAITFDVRNQLQVIWKNRPGDQYICLSYSFTTHKEINKIDWRKEGF